MFIKFAHWYIHRYVEKDEKESDTPPEVIDPLDDPNHPSNIP